MPGESISCENGIVYVNGRRQDEAYSQGGTFDFEKIQLADDEYFVMGENDDCPYCGNAFTEMHSNERLMEEAWNRRSEDG